MRTTVIAWINLLLLLSHSVVAQNATKLSGEVIGSAYSINYNTNSASTSVNTKDNAFDGDLNTFFAAYDRSNAWCGLDLGTSHQITKVGWSPRNDGLGPSRVVLGVFEGANDPDFLDAIPLHMNVKSTQIGTIDYAEVEVTRPFRYVRYVGPNDARCNIAEVEFYGYPKELVAEEDTVEEKTKEHFHQLTNLPLVVIHTDTGKDPTNKKVDVNAYIHVISKGGNKMVEDTCIIRLRGNGSLGFPKKPYHIKLNHKRKLLGSSAKAKKWTLINNYGDKTLLRNLAAFQLSRCMQMEYTPFGTAVDVMVNGEYKGTYQLCDKVEVHKHRIEVEEMTPTATSGDSITGGYMVEIDAYANQEPSMFYSNKNNPVTIHYPDDEEIVAAQKNYIKGRFNTMETRLFSSNFTDESLGYRPYLDLDSFLKHFLVGEMSGNTDTYWSVYMYKHRGDEHLYTGPVWDFDLAFENDNRTYSILNKTDYVYRSGGSYAGNMRSFVDRIVRNDTNAKQRMKELWSIARNSHGLDADTLVDFVTMWRDSIYESQALNFLRWPILNSYVHQNPRVYGSYDGEVNNVINYIRKRIPWMDKKVGYDESIIDIPDDDQPSDLQEIEEELLRDLRIYNLNGIPMDSNDIEKLPKGIYLVGGRRLHIQ